MDEHQYDKLDESGFDSLRAHGMLEDREREDGIAFRRHPWPMSQLVWTAASQVVERGAKPRWVTIRLYSFNGQNTGLRTRGSRFDS